MVGFKVFETAIDDFGTFVLSRANDEEHVTFLSLLNDGLSSFSLELFKGIDHFVQVLALEGSEDY